MVLSLRISGQYTNIKECLTWNISVFYWKQQLWNRNSGKFQKVAPVIKSGSSVQRVSSDTSSNSEHMNEFASDKTVEINASPR